MLNLLSTAPRRALTFVYCLTEGAPAISASSRGLFTEGQVEGGGGADPQAGGWTKQQCFLAPLASVNLCAAGCAMAFDGFVADALERTARRSFAGAGAERACCTAGESGKSAPVCTTAGASHSMACA